MTRRKTTTAEQGKPKPEEPGAPLGSAINDHDKGEAANGQDAPVEAASPTGGMTEDQVKTHLKNMAHVRSLVGAADALDWSDLTGAPTPYQEQPDPDAGLPDASTIDTSAIKKPVLSRQGWVMPKESQDRGPR